MTVLLDTQILLWSQVSPERLPAWLIEVLEDRDVAPIFSVVSIWEIAIKSALKRADFTHEPSTIRASLLELGWCELELTGDHVLGVSDLPALHGDPFDRILVSQSKVAKLEFVTANRALKEYGQHIRMI
jgi:PIN domain nuclease of toxin-antitoxin system